MDHRLSKAVVGAFLLLAARNACAQNLYYPNNATIDGSVGTGNPAWSIIVGYADDMDLMNRTNGTSPTVTLVDGAYVPSDMVAQNGSTINVQGGFADQLGATDRASINLSGGDVSVIVAGSSATVNITGGTMDYGPYTLDSSTLIMNGGEVGTVGGAVSIEDQSTGILDGGTIDRSLNVSDLGQALAHNMTIVGAVQTTEVASFTMTGGTIGSLSINNYSTATVTGGTIVGSMSSNSAETSTASGTTIGSVAGFAGTIGLTGTTITGSVDAASGTVNVSGGTIGGNATTGVNVSGGPAIPLSLDGGVSVAGFVSATNIGAIAIYSATVAGDVEAHQHGVVGMSDGTLNGGVNTYDSGSFIFGGGTVNGDLTAYNASTISVNGGTITGTLSDSGDQNYSVVGLNITAGTIANVANNSGHQETMSGGTIENNLTTHSQGIFKMTGGSVNGTASGYDFSTVHIDGATVTNIVAHDSSDFDLVSGTINGSIQVHDFGSVDISGGNVYGSLTEDSYGGADLSGGRIGNDAAISNYSSLSISGTGVIGGNVTAHDFSDINMSGGTITGNVDFYNNSGFYWSGGHVQGIISMHDSSFLNWTGGTFGSGNTGPHIASADSPASTPTPIYIYDNASLEIDGISLSSTLVNANANGFSLYSLAGNFGDGTPLASDIQLYIQNPTGTTTGGSLQLGHVPQQWNIATGGSWGGTANWSPALVPGGAGSIALLTGASSPATVTLDGDRTVGSLEFGGDYPYTIAQGSGGTLILDNQGNGALVSLSAGQQQIIAPVLAQDDVSFDVEAHGQNDISLTLANGITIATGKTLTKLGSGTLLTAFVRGGTLDVFGPMQILLNGTSAGVSRVEGLSINTYGAMLDLTNNDLILDYTAGNSPLDLIQEYLASGYDGGYRDGSGITSSTASENPNFSTALGYADNSVLGLTSFDGQSVGSNVILIKYTWVGDANLDGIVNAADLSAISSAGTTWATGDFNYDGVVNADDYALFMLGSAYGSVNISTTLPEPGVMLALGGLLCLRLARKV